MDARLPLGCGHSAEEAVVGASGADEIRVAPLVKCRRCGGVPRRSSFSFCAVTVASDRLRLAPRRRPTANAGRRSDEVHGRAAEDRGPGLGAAQHLLPARLRARVARDPRRRRGRSPRWAFPFQTASRPRRAASSTPPTISADAGSPRFTRPERRVRRVERARDDRAPSGRGQRCTRSRRRRSSRPASRQNTIDFRANPPCRTAGTSTAQRWTSARATAPRTQVTLAYPGRGQRTRTSSRTSRSCKVDRALLALWFANPGTPTVQADEDAVDRRARWPRLTTLPDEASLHRRRPRTDVRGLSVERRSAAAAVRGAGADRVLVETLRQVQALEQELDCARDRGRALVVGERRHRLAQARHLSRAGRPRRPSVTSSPTWAMSPSSNAVMTSRQLVGAEPVLEHGEDRRLHAGAR